MPNVECLALAVNGLILVVERKEEEKKENFQRKAVGMIDGRHRDKWAKVKMVMQGTRRGPERRETRQASRPTDARSHYWMPHAHFLRLFYFPFY